MSRNVIPNHIIKGDVCSNCGTDLRFRDSGECVNCKRRPRRKNSTQMEVVNKRRRLLKEKEIRKIEKDVYFEDNS